MTDKYIIFSFSLIRFSLFKSFSCQTAYAFLSLPPSQERHTSNGDVSLDPLASE